MAFTAGVAGRGEKAPAFFPCYNQGDPSAVRSKAGREPCPRKRSRPIPETVLAQGQVQDSQTGLPCPLPAADRWHPARALPRKG